MRVIVFEGSIVNLILGDWGIRMYFISYLLQRSLVFYFAVFKQFLLSAELFFRCTQCVL